MKSPSQSGACKCIMYVTAGKVGTWPKFLWRGQITACVRRHLCCWTAREAPTAVFTLVNVLHWYFIFIFCGCMTWRMVIIIKTDSFYSLNTLCWCTATDLLITDSRKDMSTAKTTTGTSHSIRTTHNYLKVHICRCLCPHPCIAWQLLTANGIAAMWEICVRAVKREMDMAAVKRASCVLKGRIKDGAVTMITSVWIAAAPWAPTGLWV